jgi:predicted NAD/FAD-dependent oxidoreductase
MTGASTEKRRTECLIVGAGLSGLLAAQQLQRAGVEALVLEASAEPGGRMASSQIGMGKEQARFDTGAQFFTVRSERFGQLVAQWQESGVVRQWSEGFATPDGSYYRDGYPRFRGQPDMQAISRFLAEGVAVHFSNAVQTLRYEGEWLVLCEAGSEYRAQSLILTPPVPLSLALLAAGGVMLSGDVQNQLSRMEYDPCWAVMALLDGPSRIPEPGGMWPGGDLISWLADNQRKGISEAPTVTIHATPEFSRDHLDAVPSQMAQLLLQEARPWLGAEVLRFEVRRWTHSIPVQLHHEPVLYCEQPGPLAFAGDAFAGPRVEGAALSGLAAAEAILSRAL